MGGAFEVPGNISPTAEFNFFMDPEAAQIVLESGVRPVLVGLDVCHQTHFTNRQLATGGMNSELGRFVQRECASWRPAIDAGEQEGPNLYDTLTVASAFRPDLLTVEEAFVQIETASEAGAGTSMAWRPGRWSAWSRPNGAENALVATGIDVVAFEAFFTARVLAQLWIEALYVHSRMPAPPRVTGISPFSRIPHCGARGSAGAAPASPQPHRRPDARELTPA